MVNTGVVKLVPVCKEVPPEAAVYQSKVPLPVAFSKAVLPEQMVTGEVAGGDGIELTVTGAATLLLLLQPARLACT